MSPPSAFGPYRVLHQIGSGVLGPVFRSHDTHSERLLAIKALKLDLVPEDAARVSEALRATTRRGAGISGLAEVVDCGVERGTAFLVLEYVSGDALDVYLRQSPALTLAEVRQIVSSIARTIDAAWAQEISHGALHPRDIFLGSRFDHVTLTGFGIAQSLESVGARTPVRHPYSAPERQTGGAWDRRADVYALGAIARLLAGRSSSRDLPPAWEAAIGQAMSESPADRFTSGQAFADALTSPAPASRAPAVPLVVPTSVTTAAPMTLDAAPDFDRMRETPPVRIAETQRSDSEMPAVISAVPARFPWPAVSAVGVAGLALGVVGGYLWGSSQRADRPAAQTATQAAVIPSPVPEPFQTVAPPEPTPEKTEPERPAASTAAPVARVPKPAPAATRGTLLVETRPREAAVTLDGRPAGQTPILIKDLSPGIHPVLIQLKGHRPVSSKVTIVAGEQTTLRLSLEQQMVMLESSPRKSR